MRIRFWLLVASCAVFFPVVGCDEHKKTPVSPEIQSKRDKLMKDGGIPDPRTARQKLNDE